MRKDEGASLSGKMENSSVVKMGRSRDEGRCKSRCGMKVRNLIEFCGNWEARSSLGKYLKGNMKERNDQKTEELLDS